MLSEHSLRIKQGLQTQFKKHAERMKDIDLRAQEKLKVLEDRKMKQEAKLVTHKHRLNDSFSQKSKMNVFRKRCQSENFVEISKSEQNLKTKVLEKHKKISEVADYLNKMKEKLSERKKLHSIVLRNARSSLFC